MRGMQLKGIAGFDTAHLGQHRIGTESAALYVHSTCNQSYPKLCMQIDLGGFDAEKYLISKFCGSYVTFGVLIRRNIDVRDQTRGIYKNELYNHSKKSRIYSTLIMAPQVFFVTGTSTGFGYELVRC